MERTDKPESEKTGVTGTWCVINSGVGKYIVRTELAEREVLEVMEVGGLLKAEDVFEFVSNMQVHQLTDPRTQQPAGMRLAKQTLAYRVDAALLPMPMYFSTAGATMYFLDRLKEADALVYKDIIRDAIRMGQDMHQQRIEALTQVKSAKPGDIPQVGLPFVR